MALRVGVGLFCVAGLVAVFLFQRWDIAGLLGIETNIYKFIFNRTIRFLLNDALTIGLIYALFVERKYVIFAVYVQIAGVVLFLLPYFVLKVYFPSYNGPLISFLHRLIVNPTLLLVRPSEVARCQSPNSSEPAAATPVIAATANHETNAAPSRSEIRAKYRLSNTTRPASTGSRSSST